MKCNHNTIVMRMSKHQEENFERAKKLKDEGKLVEIGNMLVDHVESQMSKVKYLESICGITDFMNLQIELYHRFINPNLQTCKWEQLSGSELLGWADVARFFIARGGKYPLEPVLLKKRIKMECHYPIYCRFCGARLKEDHLGHLCPSSNCQWSFGASTCTVEEED